MSQQIPTVTIAGLPFCGCYVKRALDWLCEVKCRLKAKVAISLQKYLEQSRAAQRAYAKLSWRVKRSNSTFSPTVLAR
jgi:hypothetical protein